MTAAPPPSWPPAGPPPLPPGLRAGGAEYPAGPPAEWPAWSATPFPGPPTAPGPPGTGGGGRPSSPAGALLAVAVVVVLVVVAVVALGALIDDADDLDSAAPDMPATTAPDRLLPDDGTDGTVPDGGFIPSLPPDSGLDPELDPEELARPLDEVLPEIIAFVEEQRGHRFRTPPAVEAMAEDAFLAALEEARSGEEDVLREQAVADQALGLIPPGTDLADVARRATSAGVLGFYEPGTGRLLVRGDSITPYVQTVIAHELTHALDDQVFDLDRIEALAERPDESAFGFVALVEGSARWVEDAFRAQLDPAEQVAVAAEELQFGLEQFPALMDLPPSFVAELQVPYTAGLELVTALVDEGGVAALDVAFLAPPRTSEQVLHVAVFRAGEPAVEVPLPAADGPVVGQGAFGLVDLALLLVAGDPFGLPGDLAAIDGFGGGSYVSWGSSDESCIRVTLDGDDSLGTERIRMVALRWEGAVAGAQVSTIPRAGESPLVTLFRCA